ncbi:MAG: hypothetical protein ACI8TP_004028 [Acidimicrobiales bacterium]
MTSGGAVIGRRAWGESPTVWTHRYSIVDPEVTKDRLEITIDRLLRDTGIPITESRGAGLSGSFVVQGETFHYDFSINTHGGEIIHSISHRT